MEIVGSPAEKIRETTAVVFVENSYKEHSKPNYSEMVFEKEGSNATRVGYSNYMTGEPIWVRVKASIVPLQPNHYRLQCQAYMVRDKGEGLFEEEIKLSSMHARSYQKLIDEVAHRLR